MKHHAAPIKGAGQGGRGGNNGARSVTATSGSSGSLGSLAAGSLEINRGRTPIIFHSESGSDSSSSPHGYSDQQPQRQRAAARRPPPYRTVPLPWAAGTCHNDSGTGSGSLAGQASTVGPPQPPVRARSVPPKPALTLNNTTTTTTTNNTTTTAKPARPKSLHQDFAVSCQPAQPVQSIQLIQPTIKQDHHLRLAAQPTYQPPQHPPPRSYPLRPSVSASAFPLSVSLQFDCLAPDWSSTELPVPSPAPAERRHFVRSSRNHETENKINNPPIPRSSSVPRAQSPSSCVGGLAGRQPRPLSHPAGPVGSQWTLNSQPANALRSHESLLNRPSNSGTSSLTSARSHGHLDGHQQQQRHHQQQQQQQPADHHEAFGCGVTAPPRWPPNCFNGFQLGATPAPAPSPSSTPSPSSRPLAHLPTDALRTNNGIRMLEKKLDLYVDIMQAQERFVQVPLA